MCLGGECVEDFKPETEVPHAPDDDGWSEWTEDDGCTSGCLMEAKGVQKRSRVCLEPLNCEGLSFDVKLCDDQKICERNRYMTPDDYATLKCREFGQMIPEVDDSFPGIQAHHEQNRLWVSCAIFCRRKDSSLYFAPRSELNALGGRQYEAYFPDGTLCHRDAQQDYYCLNHHCLPEGFQFSKAMSHNIHPFFEEYTQKGIEKKLAY